MNISKGGGSGQREDVGEVGREAMPAPHCHLISPVLKHPSGILPTPSLAAVPKSDGRATPR